MLDTRNIKFARVVWMPHNSQMSQVKDHLRDARDKFARVSGAAPNVSRKPNASQCQVTLAAQGSSF